MYLTESGGRFRSQIGPTIDRVLDDIQQLRETADKAKTVVNEGRQLVTDITARVRELA